MRSLIVFLSGHGLKLTIERFLEQYIFDKFYVEPEDYHFFWAKSTLNTSESEEVANKSGQRRVIHRMPTQECTSTPIVVDSDDCCKHETFGPDSSFPDLGKSLFFVFIKYFFFNKYNLKQSMKTSQLWPKLPLTLSSTLFRPTQGQQFSRWVRFDCGAGNFYVVDVYRIVGNQYLCVFHTLGLMPAWFFVQQKAGVDERILQGLGKELLLLRNLQWQYCASIGNHYLK